MNSDQIPHASPIPHEDLFDAWLDAMVTGESTPETAARPGNPALGQIDQVTSAATRFHGLAQAADETPPYVSRPPSWEQLMQSSSIAPVRPLRHPAIAPAQVRPRTVVTAQVWASYVLIAIVAAGLSLGLGRATNFFQDSTPPPTEENTIPFSGFVNGEGTPVPMGESSSIPYPNSANCTIDPLTREEVVAHLEAASTATEPAYAYYEQAIVPSEEDTEAIMKTFRMWQACQLNGRAGAYSMSLETPWFTAMSSPLFYAPGWTESGETLEQRIQRFADIAILNEDEQYLLYPPATPSQEELDAYATEGAMEEATYEASVVPIPEGATPIAPPTGGGFMPTIFPSDIQQIGPDVATARAVLVKQETGEISTSGDIAMRFVKIDGVWLIDMYVYSGDANRG